MAQIPQTNDLITIICQDDNQFKMKRSLLDRMRSIYLPQHLGRPLAIKLTVIKMESLLKIVQWMEHYDSNPVGADGEVLYTEWDRNFFEDVNGEAFLHLARAGKLLDVDGFFAYAMKFLEGKFKALPLVEMISINLLHDLEGDDSLARIAEYLLK